MSVEQMPRAERYNPTSKPHAGRDRGTLPSCEPGTAAFPRHQLIRETRFQPCAGRTENKGMPPHSWGKRQSSPTAAGEWRVVATPQGPPVTLLPHPTFGRDCKASRLLPALGCPGPDRICIPHQDGFAASELGTTNYGSVASCFSACFVLYLLFPNMSAGENLFSSSLFQIC